MYYSPATLALAAALLLGGCGQMGPLYLPEESAPYIPAPTLPTTPEESATADEPAAPTAPTATAEPPAQAPAQTN
ncbi:MAG: hypothetical protein H6985_00025 [Pseudomonadales bacterium]|nr:hypothetical protein [Pseudomonadales bacterium]